MKYGSSERSVAPSSYVGSVVAEPSRNARRFAFIYSLVLVPFGMHALLRAWPLSHDLWYQVALLLGMVNLFLSGLMGFPTLMHYRWRAHGSHLEYHSGWNTRWVGWGEVSFYVKSANLNRRELMLFDHAGKQIQWPRNIGLFGGGISPEDLDQLWKFAERQLVGKEATSEQIRSAKFVHDRRGIWPILRGKFVRRPGG